MAAAIAILVRSHNDEISSWELWDRAIKPSTCLAILAGIIGFCIVYIMKTGAVITWWLIASKEGTTIADLHGYWSAANGLIDALKTPRFLLNPVAIACIFASATFAIGALLQAATSIVVKEKQSVANIQVLVASDVPQGYTGVGATPDGKPAGYTVHYAEVVQDFGTNAPISMVGTGCQGRCTGRVRGLGLMKNCTDWSKSFNVETNITDTESLDVFNTDFGVGWRDGDQALYLTLYRRVKKTSSCPGMIDMTSCELHPAIVEYPVTIDGNASTITLDSYTTLDDDRVLRNISLPTWDGTDYGHTFDGLILAIGTQFSSEANLSRNASADKFSMKTNGFQAFSHMMNDDSEISCATYFRDPLEEMLAAARELMFRTVVAVGTDARLNAGEASTSRQNVTVTQLRQVAVYETNYYFLGGAIANIVAALLPSLYLYWGYGRLGRNVSLSPIEIAKAFNADVLRGVDSNATAKQIVAHTEGTLVRYGAVQPILAPQEDQIPVSASSARRGVISSETHGDHANAGHSTGPVHGSASSMHSKAGDRAEDGNQEAVVNASGDNIPLLQVQHAKSVATLSIDPTTDTDVEVRGRIINVLKFASTSTPTIRAPQAGETFAG